jgi:PD-(D/E)XK endonuclease
MRTLGYITTNGRLANGLRLRAETLGLDSSHFRYGRGGRVWPAAELEEAIRVSTSWSEVGGRLGLPTGNGDAIAKVRTLAARYGLDSRHFANQRGRVDSLPFTGTPDIRHLSRAASSMAIAWFARRGYTASLPTEPRPYDLIVEVDESLYRVQVKTATQRDARSGVVVCTIARKPRRDGRMVPYDSGDVDFFFIIDIDDRYFVVPVAEVGGNMHLSLSTVLHREVPH